MLWWFAQNFFIAAALACLVAGVCRFWRVNPVVRHAMWLIVLIKLVTPAVGAWPWAIRDPLEMGQAKHEVTKTVVSKPLVLQKPSVVLVPQSSAGAMTGVLAPSPEISIISSAPIEMIPTQAPARIDVANAPVQQEMFLMIVRVLVGVWIAGSVAFTLTQLLRIIAMMRRLRTAKPASITLAGRVAEVARQLGTPPIRIRVVSGISSPAIWAVFRPVLLWPAELPGDMSDRAIRGLIVHELAHAKRRDHWVGWLELLAGCVWWWNPLFWYARHQVRECAELACDGWVVDTIPKGRRAYAEAILAVCENLSGRTVPAPSVGARTGGRRFLERRLAMILKERFPLRLGRFQWVFVLILGLTSAPAWSQKPEEKPVAQEGAAEGLIVGKLRDARLDERKLRQDQITAYERIMRAQFRDGVRAQRAAEVPDVANALITEFEKQKVLAKMEMEERVERQRDELIAQLKDIAAKLDQTGSIREAQAVRDCIAQLQPPAQAMADPGTLQNFRDRVGQTFVFEVVGQAQGTIWGDGVYTDDSSIGVAAVHAGILKSGEQGMVQVRILPGQNAYNGAARNGVNSSPYGPWQGSYTISAFHRAVVAGPPAVAPAPGAMGPFALSALRDRVGQVIGIDVVGSNTGTVWGDGVYTDDSPVAVAAVHAGLLQVGQRGIVYVMIMPGQESYPAAERNGVTSQTWPAFGGSYKFVQPRAAIKGLVQNAAPQPVRTVLDTQLRSWVNDNGDYVKAKWHYYLMDRPGSGDSAGGTTPASPTR